VMLKRSNIDDSKEEELYIRTAESEHIKCI
jgi:hypothetical protein